MVNVLTFPTVTLPPTDTKEFYHTVSKRLERSLETCHTIDGEASKMKSEMNVTKSQADEQTGRDTRGRGSLQTTNEIGTTGGTRQMARDLLPSGVCQFTHPDQLCGQHDG